MVSTDLRFVSLVISAWPDNRIGKLFPDCQRREDIMESVLISADETLNEALESSAYRDGQ